MLNLQEVCANKHDTLIAANFPKKCGALAAYGQNLRLAPEASDYHRNRSRWVRREPDG